MRDRLACARAYLFSVARICDGTSMGSQAMFVHPSGVSKWPIADQITMIGHSADWLDAATFCNRNARTRVTKFDACSAWAQYSALPPNLLMTALASSALPI